MPHQTSAKIEKIIFPCKYFTIFPKYLTFLKWVIHTLPSKELGFVYLFHNLTASDMLFILCHEQEITIWDYLYYFVVR